MEDCNRGRKKPAKGKSKRIIRRIEGRQSDAQQLMAKLMTELHQGTYIEPARVTVGDWLDTWLNDYKKMELLQTTWESYETQVRVHLKPAIGKLNIQDLRPDHLQKLYNEKVEAGLSPRSARYIHVVINSALKQAVKNQLVLRNVAEATTLPKREKSQARALTMAGQALFLEVIRKDRLAPAFLLLLTTGLRRGELLGLRWRNIDLTNKVLSVEENLVISREHTTLYQPPKTERSKGQIPLNEISIDALKAHRKEMLSEGHCSPNLLSSVLKMGRRSTRGISTENLPSLGMQPE